MVQIQISIDNVRLKEALNKLSHRIIDMSAPMQEISIIMYKDVMSHFANEQGSRGKWAGLEKSTLKQREKKGYTGNILMATGRHLYSRITMQSSKKNAIVGLNNKWATTHQFGWPERNIPQRDFLWLSSEAKTRIMDNLHKYLKES